MKHGIRCGNCEGTGYIEIPDTTHHPYGDTYAAEDTSYDVDCPDCDGKGYELDDSTCIVCEGEVENGIVVQGWEVCEDCSEDEVPTLHEEDR